MTKIFYLSELKAIADDKIIVAFVVFDGAKNIVGKGGNVRIES